MTGTQEIRKNLRFDCAFWLQIDEKHKVVSLTKDRTQIWLKMSRNKRNKEASELNESIMALERLETQENEITLRQNIDLVKNDQKPKKGGRM